MKKIGIGRELRSGSGDEALARVAHLYYILGMTQAEVASRIGITRFKVNRMLAQARELGMVRIEINVPSVGRLDLERRLERLYGLNSAFVCPSDTSENTSVSEVIGRYAASIVAQSLEDGMVIASSWGETLHALALSINPEAARDLCVASMLGTLTSQTDIEKFGAAPTLAARLRAECLFIPGPIICDSVTTKDAINAQPAAQLAMDRARLADLALLSVGGHCMSSLREASILSEGDYDRAVSAGAIGNFLGKFIGSDGAPIDHDLNDRAVGIEQDQIGNIPCRLLCAGGEHKVDAIRVILERGYATALTTDENTARKLFDAASTRAE